MNLQSTQPHQTPQCHKNAVNGCKHKIDAMISSQSKPKVTTNCLHALVHDSAPRPNPPTALPEVGVSHSPSKVWIAYSNLKPLVESLAILSHLSFCNCQLFFTQYRSPDTKIIGVARYISP